MRTKKSAKQEEVEKRVTIPMYFYEFILPQLPEYYSQYTVDFDVKPVACCPLHDEDTPSFRYYEETNTFHCFGCKRGGPKSGTVVNLHRMFQKRMNDAYISVDQAVNFLYKYFIEGRDTLPALVITPEKKLNQPADLVKLNYYRSNIEKSITFDRSIPINKKLEFWEMMDDIDVLMSKDIIRASDAKEYISESIRGIMNN